MDGIARIILAALSLALGPMEANAQSSRNYTAPQNDGVHLHLPEGLVVFYGAPVSGEQAGSARSTPNLVPLPEPEVSLGALNLHLGGGSSGTHLTHYDFGESHFLGGQLSGTLDGRAGTIRLSWPTGE